MNKPLLIVMSVLLLGCGTSYQQTEVTPSLSSLEPGKSVLISAPQDGSYGANEYKGSGQMAAVV